MLATVCLPRASQWRVVGVDVGVGVDFGVGVVVAEYSCTDAHAHSKAGKLSQQVEIVVDERTTIHSKQESKVGKMRACKGAIEFR